MEQEAARRALLKISAGFKDLADALVPPDLNEKPQTQRDIEFMLEFNRPDGTGLTQEEARNACREHSYTRQTIGAWVRGGWLRIDEVDGLRYLTDDGRKWIQDNGGTVPSI